MQAHCGAVCALRLSNHKVDCFGTASGISLLGLHASARRDWLPETARSPALVTGTGLRGGSAVLRRYGRVTTMLTVLVPRAGIPTSVAWAKSAASTYQPLYGRSPEKNWYCRRIVWPPNRCIE